MNLQIREIRKQECAAIGRLMVDVYSHLEGFPSPREQPDYYEMLENIGSFNERDSTTVFVALSEWEQLLGGVVYFNDMAAYGSGGTATHETNASGIRLLGVSANARGAGVGKALTEACIKQAREDQNAQVILHTTQAMEIAWGLYERLGFERSTDLDFLQQGFPVFGFRLQLK